MRTYWILIFAFIISVFGANPRLFIGGQFDFARKLPAGTIQLDGLAIWDDEWLYWSDLNGGLSDRTAAYNATNPGTAINDDIYTSYWDDKSNLLFIGGLFHNIGNVTSTNIVAYDIDSGLWIPLASSCDGKVLAIQGTDGGIVVGGEFQNVDSVPASGLALLTRNSWQWSDLGGSLGGTVSQLAFSTPYLFVGGTFSQAHSLPASNFAAYDFQSHSWSVPGYVCGSILDMDVLQDNLYIVGNFSSFGTPSCPSTNGYNIAQFSLSTFNFTDSIRLSSSDIDGFPTIVLADGDKIFLTGTFTRITNVPISSKFGFYYPSSNTWARAIPLSQLTGNLKALALSQTSYYFAGYFTANNYNGVAKYYNISTTYVWNNMYSGISCSFCPEVASASDLGPVRFPTVNTMTLLPPGQKPTNTPTQTPSGGSLKSYRTFEDYNIPIYPGVDQLYLNETVYADSTLGSARPLTFYWQTWSVIGSAIFVCSLLLATVLNTCVLSDEF